jgi:diguanylate cyclase (GGDEF)-like protein/PAS domain S-box-containing protein
MTTGSLDERVRFEASLAESTEAMILADGGGSLLFINPAAEILFGRLNQDLAGITVTDLFPGLCDEPCIAAWKAQVASAGATATVPMIREARGQRADGDFFPVRLWLSGQLIDGEPRVLVNVQDLSEAERQDRDLAYLRAHDQLTGLINRQQIFSHLAMVAAHASDGAQGVRVICHLDLDQFTIVNTTCGPRAGDKLLQQVARLIEAKLAPAEALARVGGDAFGVLLPHGDLDAAVDLCDALMQTVRGFLFTWQDRAFDVALSIGITAWDPRTEPPEEAMGRAEIACRLAKRSGRNRIHVYREGETDLSQFRTDMHLVATINRALSSGGFHLFAQPIVAIGPDAPGEQHFEILVRMVGDAGLLVAPSRFIPAAEHYILMPAVDRWIINHLFVQQGETLRVWHQRHPDAFLFAVNLSGTTVADEGFRRYLKRQFEDCRVPYPSVCFEITETAAIGSLAGAAAFIEEFSALGCRFALDDFGTGLSSYAYLRALGVHYLKIDGSFVRGLAEDPVNRALVESINRVAHVLGLKTIAEWAEDEPTLAALRQIGVDYAQGYAVGMAVLMPAFSLSETDAGPSDLPGPP